MNKSTVKFSTRQARSAFTLVDSKNHRSLNFCQFLLIRKLSLSTVGRWSHLIMRKFDPTVRWKFLTLPNHSENPEWFGHIPNGSGKSRMVREIPEWFVIPNCSKRQPFSPDFNPYCRSRISLKTKLCWFLQILPNKQDLPEWKISRPASRNQRPVSFVRRSS